MSLNGRYCKAYQVARLREFDGWAEGVNPARRQLEEGAILYIQENYTVTDSIFIDENVVFDRVTPEWVEFCRTVLGFEAPSAEPAA
jgi:hypothetical protein